MEEMQEEKSRGEGICPEVYKSCTGGSNKKSVKNYLHSQNSHTFSWFCSAVRFRSRHCEGLRWPHSKPLCALNIKHFTAVSISETSGEREQVRLCRPLWQIISGIPEVSPRVSDETKVC